MEENINLLDSYYLGVVEKDLREKSNGAKILNDNQIDNYEMLGIDKDKDAGVINLQYKDEKQKEADGMSFAEGLLEFAKDVPSSSIYSVGLAGVNGADVMVNFIPLFDKLFSLDPNYRSNDNLMKKMQDWDKNLANARKFLNDKRDQNQKVSQFVGMVFQDVPYAIPLHKAFKKAGMPTWMSMPLAFGVGYGLGFDEKHVSMFLNSKDMRAIKDFIKIMPDTPEDKLFDNMYQMFEGTAFAGILPQVWQGIKFAKRNIPKVANALNTEQVGTAIAGGTAAAVVGSTEAKSNPKIAKEVIKYGAKKIKKIFHETDQDFKDFDVNKVGGKAVWFTEDMNQIKAGKTGASGHGKVIERSIDESKLKLATGEQADKLFDDQLFQQGYDGIKFSKSEGYDATNYKIFFESLNKLPKK